MVTIRDVAREAGVSVASASRALNGHLNVTPETRARVELAASALRYVPHSGARSLTRRKSDALGVRPEHWRAGDGGAGIRMRADFIERLGSSVNIHLRPDLPGTPPDAANPDRPAMVWHHVEPARVREGETVSLTPDPEHLHLFAADGLAIARP